LKITSGEIKMKRIQLCAMFLGLLTCSALAADQQQLVDGSGNVISNAQFFLVVAGQNKLVELPQTNGTVNLSALSSQPNIANQPIEAWVYRCDQDPKWRVYYLSPGQTAPENKEHCDKWKLAVLWFDGSHWVIKEGPEAGSPVHLQQGPSGTPVSTGSKGEGPSILNATAQVAMGPWKALDLQRECIGVPGCTTNDIGFSLEAGAGPSFGPFEFQMGVFHTASVKTTETETFTGSEGTVTETSRDQWHVNAFVGTARANVLGIKVWGDHRIILGAQGGPMVWSIKGTSSFSGPTASGSEGFSYGGTSAWFGGHGEFTICDRLAATLDYQHTDLQKTFSPGSKLTQNINAVLFGLKFSVTRTKTLFTIR
jgi:hypothetical protein